DETLLEIATDKVDSEIPSAAEGILEEILFQINAVVPIGSVIGRIKTLTQESSASNSQTPMPEEPAVATTRRDSADPAPMPHSSNGNRVAANSNNRFYSPLVLNIASSEGVGLSELETIPGTGNEGRVTKRDILHYLSQRKTGAGSQP